MSYTLVHAHRLNIYVTSPQVEKLKIRKKLEKLQKQKNPKALIIAIHHAYQHTAKIYLHL